jgi:hypothetical protein
MVSQFPYSWIRQLRTTTAIAMLLTTASWSVAAETVQNEKLNEVTSKLRACVRTYAPAHQAAGTQNTADAINFFVETCFPTIKISDLTNPGAAPSPRPGALSLSDLDNAGAIPPGLFRRVIAEELADIFDQTRTR